MANQDSDRTSPPETPEEDMVGPKRPSHTIDLKAKEVDPADEAAEGEPDGDAEDVDGAEQEAPAEDEPPPRTQPSEVRGFVTHLAAGLVGGLIGVLAIGYGLDKLPYSSLIAPPPEPAIDKAALDARFAQVDARIADLPKPAPVDGLKRELAALAARTAEAETRAKTAAAGLDTRTAAAKATADRIAKLEAELAAEAEAGAAANRKVTRLEETLKSLGAAASEGSGGDVAQAAALAAQISDLARQTDDRIAALRTDLEARAAKLGTASGPELDVLKAEGAALKAETDKLAAALSEARDALAQRMAKLETELAGLADRQKKIGGDVRGRALVVGFANLQTAVDRGEPFAAELKALGTLAPDAAKLAALKAHAAKGVRTFAQLERGFPAAVDAALEAASGVGSNTVIGQLLHNARGLVKVRRIEPDKGDGTGATLARMEKALKSGDFATALKEAEVLKAAPKAAAAMKAWIDGVRQRLAVDRDMAALKSQLLGGAGGKTSGG